MDTIIQRFQWCDNRFYPYLEKVLNRVPGQVRQDILDKKEFEIISDDDFLSAHGLHYHFDNPVTNLIYLNTMILKKPENNIIYLIAHQFAHHYIRMNKEIFSENEVKELLATWEFNNEVDQIKNYDSIAESEGYKIGYEWAKGQKVDDLLWHFERYCDEWNERRLSTKRFEQLYWDIAPFSIINQMRNDEKDKDESESPRGKPRGIFGAA